MKFRSAVMEMAVLKARLKSETVEFIFQDIIFVTVVPVSGLII